MCDNVHPISVGTDHCTSQYRFLTVSYQPGPVGLWYSPREVCTSIARGTLTLASVDECKDLAEGCRQIHDIWSTNGSLERCQCVVWGSDSDDTNVGGVEEVVLWYP